ncbi:MAG TPA: class I SAM-dependent methyltransferase [Cyclobacteriaceae bacterium]|nr:class I SAM-dependent methyltransferase [Cyclobacteriaceae bacterium]
MKYPLPSKFKRKIYSVAERYVQQQQLAARQDVEKAIPKYELAEKNIANLKTLVDRTALLRHMPTAACCAEIGVNRGEFSEEILQITRPSKLHLIDMWGDPGRYNDVLKNEVEKKFATQVASKTVEINVGRSTEVLTTFPDAYFDWVYLDTDHTYKTTSEELAILTKKMRPDGIIAGHDYVTGNFLSAFRYGVIEAVHEVCVTLGWEIIYLTIETAGPRSFAIKKIR